MPKTTQTKLAACQECDLLIRLAVTPTTTRHNCPRCGMLIRRTVRHGIDKALALYTTGVFLFVLANVFPLLSLNAKGQIQETTLISGSIELLKADQPLLAMLVLLTSFIFPLFDLLGMLYVLWPIKLGRRAPFATRIYRYLRTLRPWGMLEIFMLGILVALVKLSDLATVVPGIALYSFGLLIFVLAAATYVTDPDWVWEELEAQK